MLQNTLHVFVSRFAEAQLGTLVPHMLTRATIQNDCSSLG